MWEGDPSPDYRGLGPLPQLKSPFLLNDWCELSQSMILIGSNACRGSVSEPTDGRGNHAPTESRQINSHQAFKSPDSLEFGSGVAFRPNSGELREV